MRRCELSDNINNGATDGLYEKVNRAINDHLRSVLGNTMWEMINDDLEKKANTCLLKITLEPEKVYEALRTILGDDAAQVLKWNFVQIVFQALGQAPPNNHITLKEASEMLKKSG